MTVRELDNEIRISKGEPPIIEEPTPVEVSSNIVEEVGPKVETVSFENKMDMLLGKRIPLPVENEETIEIEVLDDEPIESNPVSYDLKAIDALLRKTKSYTLKDAINEIKTTGDKLRNRGFDLRIEEMDFENTYQIVIKIEKDK